MHGACCADREVCDLTGTHARRLKIRPQLGAAFAAGVTDKAGFNVGQPDIIAPAVGAGFDVVAATVVAA